MTIQITITETKNGIEYREGLCITAELIDHSKSPKDTWFSRLQILRERMIESQNKKLNHQ